MVPGTFWRCAQEVCGPGHVTFVVVVLRMSMQQVKDHFRRRDHVHDVQFEALCLVAGWGQTPPLNERSENSDCYCDAAGYSGFVGGGGEDCSGGC